MLMALDYQKNLPQVYISPQKDLIEDLCQCPCQSWGTQIKRETSMTVLVNNLIKTKQLSDSLIMLAKNLITMPVKDHFLKFNPYQGDFLIFDDIGENIIQQFRTPIKFHHIVSSEPFDSENVLTQFLSLLLFSGVLNQINMAKTTPQFESRPKTLVIWMHLTNQCNLNCRYCFVPKSSESISQRIADQMLKLVFFTAVSNGYKKIELKYSGGEPTIEPDRLIQIHRTAEKYAREYQIDLEANILTNGVTIPDYLMKFSLDHRIKWAISLDGLATAHNEQRPLTNGGTSFQSIITSLDKLQQYGISPHISITLTRLNLQEIPLLIEFLLAQQLQFSINFYRQWKYSGVQVNLHPDNEALILALRKMYAIIEQHLPSYSLLSLLLDRVDLREPHLYPCTAGYHYLTAGHQGNVAPCQMLVSQATDFTLDTELPLMPYVQFKNFKNPAVLEKEDCNEDCPWRYFCAGGCPLDAFHTYGTYHARSPYCEVYRALAPEVLRLEALRLLKYGEPIDWKIFEYN